MARQMAAWLESRSRQQVVDRDPSHFAGVQEHRDFLTGNKDLACPVVRPFGRSGGMRENLDQNNSSEQRESVFEAALETNLAAESSTA